MIEGFKIDVTSAELVTHLRTKTEYHAGRAAAYARQAGEVGQIQEDDGGGSNTYSNNPRQSLAQSAESHKKRAAYFAFLADHVVPSEVYRLDERDLERLDISVR